MAVEILTTEPIEVRAGNTWRWRRTLSDFPASVWSLTYTLYNAAGVIRLTASADGDAHLVGITPVESAAHAPGVYDWIAHVSDGTDKYEIARGSMRVLPDLSSATSYDGRSQARKIVDAIDAIIAGSADAGQIHVVKTAGGDLNAELSPEVLQSLRKQYAAIVASEDRAAAIANGERPGTLQMRFAGGR
jgi:hypothetical protein